MKALIAIVMFLFGLFVGILIMAFIRETVTPMYIEEEYSAARIKTLMQGFGVTLPIEAEDINCFFKQDGTSKRMWVKFMCPEEVKESVIAQLTEKHEGIFNRDVESPKMFDGTVITWWSYRNSFRYYEFDGMCAAYDDLLHNFYLYAVSDGSGKENSQEKHEE